MVALGLVLAAADQRVELDRAAAERLELTRRGRQDGCAPRQAKRVDVARDEEHRVHLRELVPRQPIVVAARAGASARRS